MKQLLATLTALIALALPLRANDQITHFTLDNGMDVLVIEDHRAPVVVHMVWYRAGSADETPGVSGVAHFLEHLMFKATENLESGELSATVARNGGRDNAFTSYDYTGFYQRVAADRLDLMMQMESDRMVNLRLNESDIATERDVIIEERNQRTENNPSALFREQKNAALYLNHHYGVPVIGWHHEMEGLGLEDAQAFYNEFYAPNNAVLVVAGDTTPDTVRALAEKYYGVLEPNPALEARDRPSEPRQIAERRLIFRDARVAQPYVSRSYIAPERDPGDQKQAAALVMLAELLGGGQTSWLTEKLQFDTQTAVYTGAFYDGLALDDTTFTLFIVPAQGVTLRQAEDAMDKAVADFIETGVDADQLARIKFQVHAAQVYARDNVENLANNYGEALASGLTAADVQAWPEILQAVTEEDILAAARDVLVRDRSVTGWLMSDQQEVTQ